MNLIFCGKTEIPITSCQLHSHDSWEIILQTSATATAEVGNVQYSLKSGDILIIPPYTPHMNYSDEPFTDIYMQCHHFDNFISPMLYDHEGSVLSLMNLLHRTLVERSNNYKKISDDICQLICDFLDKYNQIDSDFSFITTLKNEFYQNISTIDFSVAEAIKRTGYHTDYVRRCFREEIGMTPLEYFTNMKLNYAKQLLLQDNYVGVADVSERCGYSDSFYFSRLFKKYFNISPLNYRNSKKQKYQKYNNAKKP